MTWHLFEFMDHPRTPRVIRETLLDVLDFCNTTFRPYYRQVAEQVIDIAQERGITHIVELGAGRAPLSRELSRDPRASGWKLVPCDLYPDTETWEKLAATSAEIQPLYEPVDFTKPHSWPPGTALLLVAALHHIPSPDRPALLNTLVHTADCVLIFEPVCKTAASMLLTFFSWFPALLTPFFTFRNPGWIRRIAFCWFLPIAPAMFTWDGLVSCLRQWRLTQWNSYGLLHTSHGLTDRASSIQTELSRCSSCVLLKQL